MNREYSLDHACPSCFWMWLFIVLMLETKICNIWTQDNKFQDGGQYSNDVKNYKELGFLFEAQNQSGALYLKIF